jgi:hypothetical protein
MPLPIYAGQSARWADVILSAQSRLARLLGLDPAFVAIRGREAVGPPPGFETRSVVLRYYGPQPFTDAGAGRRGMPTTRLVRVFLFTRNSIDVEGDDTHALTDELGHADFEDQVLDVLTNAFPLDASTDPPTRLAIEPWHPVDSAGGPPQRDPDGVAGMIWSYLDFEAKYVPKIQTVAEG